MPKTNFNFSLGASISAWLLAVLVVGAELSKPFKELLAKNFGHHWIGKGIIIAAAFFVFGFLLGKVKEGKFSSERIAWYSVLGSLLIILLFYLWEFFK